MKMQKPTPKIDDAEGILLVNKPSGKTSFSLVSILRKILNVRKIGHAGTLDPLATGLMVMLIGKSYTKKSDHFLSRDKEYIAEIHLGIETDSYDREGNVIKNCDHIPLEEDIDHALAHFQGDIKQTPPMFSAKKVGGKKLYELARKGVVIPRKPIYVHVQIEKLSYCYPKLVIRVNCSKGTYVRTLAHDIGVMIGCGGHLTELQRTRSGSFHLSECYKGDVFQATQQDIKQHLLLDHENLQKSQSPHPSFSACHPHDR